MRRVNFLYYFTLLSGLGFLALIHNFIGTKLLQ